MDRQKFWLETMTPLLVVVGWIVAPVIDAKIKGTPLNGLSGIASFWKAHISYPVPLWAVATVIVLVVVGGAAYSRSWKKQFLRKPDLRVVVLSTPKPTWSFGSFGSVPCLNLSLHAKLAHPSAGSLEIVSAYLEGTKCEAPFFPIVVAGAYDPSQMIHFGVRPVIARDGRPLKRRIVLVDQFGNKHRTCPVTFFPSSQPPQRFDPGGTSINCHFCGKAIAMEDFCENSVVPAHKRCVR